MGTIYWNGIPSSSVSVVVEEPPSYHAAERDYEMTHIPGRSGDFLIDNGSYRNVTRSYKIAFGSIRKTHSEMASAVSEWLHSANGYTRLEDTYEPEYYRLAIYKDDVNLTNILNHLGRATIDFDCMPQRFLKSGERPITFSISPFDSYGRFTLKNPTSFKSKPLIIVTGRSAGSLVINGLNLAINMTPPEHEVYYSITIDSDLCEVYNGQVSYNSFISWPNRDRTFPVLNPGENDIYFSGGIGTVEVIPRWWTL